MSVPSALEFVRQVRGHESWLQKIASAQPLTDLETLVTMGAEAGFNFGADDLRVAFRHDWRMRWLTFSARHEYHAAATLPQHPDHG